jgi:hypothetical protein
MSPVGAQVVPLSAQRMDVAAITKVSFNSADRVREVISYFNADGFPALSLLLGSRQDRHRPDVVYRQRFRPRTEARRRASGGCVVRTLPGTPSSASAVTRSGRSIANHWLQWPPVEWATMGTRSMPRLSRTGGECVAGEEITEADRRLVHALAQAATWTVQDDHPAIRQVGKQRGGREAMSGVARYNQHRRP